MPLGDPRYLKGKGDFNVVAKHKNIRASSHIRVDISGTFQEGIGTQIETIPEQLGKSALLIIFSLICRTCEPTPCL
jgi:hypothetical protein